MTTKQVKKKKRIVLSIGDIHEPFTLKGYLEFCKKIYKEYNCDTVVFSGDIIDNHYSSYHETDSNGMGGDDELQLAKKKISKWYKAFPDAYVTIGNHDRMIMRKAQTSAIPTEWIREYKDVLKTPGWTFVDRVVIDNVQYIHMEVGKAEAKAKADMMSSVGGHWHTEAYVKWMVGANFKVFGCQVGSGIDWDSYAMGYAKRGKKPAVGCAVIKHGKVATNILMDL